MHCLSLPAVSSSPVLSLGIVTRLLVCACMSTNARQFSNMHTHIHACMCMCLHICICAFLHTRCVVKERDRIAHAYYASILTYHAPMHDQAVADLPLSSDTDRCRAWIRLALNDKSVEPMLDALCHMPSLESNYSVCRRFACPSLRVCICLPWQV